VFVVKPALHGDVARALESLAPCADRVVFSSAFETALGARDSLRAAFGFCRANRLPVPRRAMGFGVWPLFEDQRFNAPFVGSFLRESDVEFINPEALWNALS
jgi:O-succinylbenzoate synthase